MCYESEKCKPPNCCKSLYNEIHADFSVRKLLSRLKIRPCPAVEPGTNSWYSDRLHCGRSKRRYRKGVGPGLDPLTRTNFSTANIFLTFIFWEIRMMNFFVALCYKRLVVTFPFQNTHCFGSHWRSIASARRADALPGLFPYARRFTAFSFGHTH